LLGLQQSLALYIWCGGSFLENNMSNVIGGFFLGVSFTVLVTFVFKENTVIYKDGYKNGIATCEVTK
jgi:hypothetical protein